MAEERPIPADVSAWLAVFEAHLKDQDNEALEELANDLLDDILDDRGIERPS